MAFLFRPWAAFSVLFLLAGIQSASALQYTLRCEGRFSYRLTYDDTRRRLTIEVEGMKRLLQIRATKQDEEGVLIWGSTPAFGGDRDMLIRIGPKKWVRTYFRNGSEETINCR